MPEGAMPMPKPRVWASISYRLDIDAGQEISREVAESALARAFGD